MSREIELARTAARGAFHIFIGKIISRAIGILGGIILIRLLKPEEYGLISIAIVAPSILLLFSDLGVDTAITKYLSEYRSKNEIGNLKPLFYSGLIFRLIISCILTIICFFIAEPFASIAVGKPYVATLIQIASLLIFAWALSSFSESVFLGFDATKSYAVFLIIMEILLSAMPIVLVLYGMGVRGALLGMVVANLIASLMQVLTSVFITIKTTRGLNAAAFTFNLKSALKTMLVFGIPIQAVIFIGTGLGRYYNFMIAAYCAPSDVGNYSVAEKSNAFIDYMTWPISLILFPTFSKMSHEESSTLKKALKYSVKYSSFFILPVVIVIVVLAHPLTVFLFGIDYEASWIYLTLLAMGSLGYGLGGVHLRKLMLSQGETKFIAMLDTLSALIGIIVGLLLIPLYGVLGFLVTNLVTGWPSYIIMFKKAQAKYRVMPPLKDMGRLYLSIVITGAAVALVASMTISELFKLVLGLFVGVVTYMISVVLTNAIKQDDLDNLREITRTQPVINVVADKIFKILELIVK